VNQSAPLIIRAKPITNKNITIYKDVGDGTPTLQYT